VSTALTERQGLANTVVAGEEPQGRILWLESVEDADRRAALWAQIVSGARPSAIRLAKKQP
jgi:hypothetical protein